MSGSSYGRFAVARVAAGPVGRRTRMTVRAALLSVASERQQRRIRGGTGVTLAVPPEGHPMSAAEIEAAAARGVPHYREPYGRLIAALKAGDDVEVGRVLAQEALRRARRPIPIAGRRFVLTGEDHLEPVPGA